MTEIRCPDCPPCGSTPLLGGMVIPFMCQNEDCKVMSWDPTKTPAFFRDPSFVWSEVGLGPLFDGPDEEGPS